MKELLLEAAHNKQQANDMGAAGWYVAHIQPHIMHFFSSLVDSTYCYRCWRGVVRPTACVHCTKAVTSNEVPFGRGSSEALK